MIGPRVAMTKRSRANCTAVNNWPRMKNTWAGSTMRVRRVASAIWASLKPGSTARRTGETKGMAAASRTTEPISQHPGDRPERPPGVLLVAGGETPGEDGDQGDGHVGPGQQVVEEVGDDEGDEVLVAGRPGAEQPGEDHLAEEAEHPREQGAPGDDEGGDAHAPVQAVALEDGAGVAHHGQVSALPAGRE